MSFRELRNFTEVMRALGYPRLISMENFRTPNFELVADCLYWLVRRYDPGTDVSDDISTEAERVAFLQSVAATMLTKARLKLSIKGLYAADGRSVKEMLKIASLLHQATLKATAEAQGDLADDSSSAVRGLSGKEIRSVCSDITQSGVALHDALESEPRLRETRLRAAGAHIDTVFVEKTVNEAVAEIEESIKSHKGMLSDLDRTLKSLESKIEKRKTDLDRSEKRLSTLQSVRPGYMDEYEKLKTELQSLYGQYLERCRNLQYLEAELNEYYMAEQDQLDASNKKLRKLQNRLREEELRILRGEQDVHEGSLDDLTESSGGAESEDHMQGQGLGTRRAEESRASVAVERGRVMGSLGGGDEDDKSDMDSLGASSDDDGDTESTMVSIIEEGDDVFDMQGEDSEVPWDVDEDDDDGAEFSNDNF